MKGQCSGAEKISSVIEAVAPLVHGHLDHEGEAGSHHEHPRQREALGLVVHGVTKVLASVEEATTVREIIIGNVP